MFLRFFQTTRTIIDFKVSLNGTNTNAEDKVKYLRILVDSNLNFRNHLEIVEQKLSRGGGIINKLKFILP